MNNYGDYIQEIVKASKYGKLVFFIGAGLSTLSDYPQWSKLVDEYYSKLYGRKKEGRYSSDEYLKIPQIFYDVKGKNEYEYILKNVFDVKKEPNQIHYSILAMNPMHIITTNYDNLIEKTCFQRGKYFSIISEEDDVARAASSRYILKVHGDFRRGFKGENIVLKESDYVSYDLNFQLISNLMRTIIATHTIVFIGYGLADYNIKLLLNWVKQLQKESYNKPFFIRTDHEAIEENDLIYYENRGLRIIDATKFVKTEKNDYMKRYESVMNLLIESRDNDNLGSQEEDVINYIYQKVSPLFVLNKIRKVDLKYIFGYDYHFEVNGLVVNNKNKGFGYLEHFFEIKEQGVPNLSSEIKLKFERLSCFFDLNKILCMANKLESKGIISEFKINSPAYHNDYEEMEKIIQTDSGNIELDYVKAFYLACLGRWEESYNLYSDIISKTVDRESEWWINYLSQINRYRLYQSIIQTKYYYGGAGLLVYRTQFEPFTQKFISRIESELKNFNINDVFQSMPYEFQEKYKILEFLSDSQFLYEDTVKLFELTNKVRGEIIKGTYSVGSLTTDVDVQFRLNDNIGFLYENSVWAVNFTEFKKYVRNSLMLQFEKAEYDQTRDVDDFGFFMGAGRSNFHIDYYDFVNITKFFNIDDVKYLERTCELGRFVILDLEDIEKYIIRMAENLIKHFSFEGMDIVFYNMFISEVKTAFYFAKYLKLSETCIVKLFKAILFYYPEIDSDIGVRYYWLDRITKCNGLPKDAIFIIEEFLIKQANKYKESAFAEQTTNGLYSINFINLIKHYYKDFTSSILSEFALNLSIESKNQVDYMYRLSPILSKDSKEHISSMKQINGINDLMDGLRIGDVKHISEYEDLVIGFIRERFSTIKNDKENGIFKGYADNYIVEFAIQYFVGEIKNPQMKDFIGVDDEYDLFVDPENYDYRKFKPIWLKKYGGELLEIISKNKHMRPKVLEVLKERIGRSKDEKYIDILIKYFV